MNNDFVQAVKQGLEAFIITLGEVSVKSEYINHYVFIRFTCNYPEKKSAQKLFSRIVENVNFELNCIEKSIPEFLKRTFEWDSSFDYDRWIHPEDVKAYEAYKQLIIG